MGRGGERLKMRLMLYNIAEIMARTLCVYVSVVSFIITDKFEYENGNLP